MPPHNREAVHIFTSFFMTSVEKGDEHAIKKCIKPGLKQSSHWSLGILGMHIDKEDICHRTGLTCNSMDTTHVDIGRIMESVASLLSCASTQKHSFRIFDAQFVCGSCRADMIYKFQEEMLQIFLDNASRIP
ncbi:hypothetical protein O6H91_12G096300 [Diphasiastrum complanatum]|uniref:Uncharacterized protein n=1 Tax=Diphasiastrum complanatum TaxID=34168 RepID=A0ACC2C5Z0_DIPCM|nr:hypothetical protein O6H91_12G096300 [Diphasiastrum complanatum]